MIIDDMVVDLNSVLAHPIYDKDGEFDRNFRKGDCARHFKGNLYMFIGIGQHSETGEELVFYQSLSGENQRKMYARPVEMFLSKTDIEKYPDAQQEYRFIKVFLEKKSTTDALTSITLSQETSMGVLSGVRKFLHSFSPDNNEKIQFWVTDAGTPAMLKMQRPTNPKAYMKTLQGEANVHHTISYGRIIQFCTEEAKETIRPGDTVHFVGDNRMVVENSEEHVYEFFEIVPIVD